MKKNFTLGVIMASLMGIGSIDSQAQNAYQIKGDFDEQSEWNSKAEGSIVPEGWYTSNVKQTVKIFVNVDMFYTAVREGENRTEETGKSVMLVNPYCGVQALGIGSNAPAYISLGEPYAFADTKGLMGTAKEDKGDHSSGSTLGGLDFTAKPDSIIGYYKRSYGSEGPENAYIITYLWKGTFKSNILTSRDSKDFLVSEVKDNAVDCILGKETADVVEDGNTGVLIASNEHMITTALDEWTRISVPFNYINDETPEKLGVIISSADYYNRPNIKKDNTLWVDDVELIYNSKLESISLDGTPLEEFDKNQFTYNGLSLADGNNIPAITAVADGRGATVEVEPVTDGYSATITVKGNDYEVNNNNAHTYTLNFAVPSSVENAIQNTVKVYYADNLLHVSGANGNDIEIFNMQGQQIGQFSSDNTTINAGLQNNTLYIVKIGNFVTRILAQ